MPKAKPPPPLGAGAGPARWAGAAAPAARGAAAPAARGAAVGGGSTLTMATFAIGPLTVVNSLDTQPFLPLQSTCHHAPSSLLPMILQLASAARSATFG